MLERFEIEEIFRGAQDIKADIARKDIIANGEAREVFLNGGYYDAIEFYYPQFDLYIDINIDEVLTQEEIEDIKK
jgi:hypothetical protein